MSRLIPRRLYTLTMICDSIKILLGFKKRGYGMGRWNLFGGIVEDGETVVSAALREVKENCGLVPTDLTKIGTLEFEYCGIPGILHVHVFKSETFTGELQESEEMKPQWFLIDQIPFDQMWLDDKFWLPIALADLNFYGYFLYGNEGKLLEKSVKILLNDGIIL